MKVKEIFAAVIIINSHNFFSSSVILMKKKDVTWHMCIKYRALNKVNMPDKFSILIIDELLDELHESQFF